MNQPLKACFLFLFMVALLAPATAFSAVDSVWGTDTDFVGRDNGGNGGGSTPGQVTQDDWDAHKDDAVGALEMFLAGNGSVSSLDMWFSSSDILAAMQGTAKGSGVTADDINAVLAAKTDAAVTDTIKGVWDVDADMFVTNLYSFTAVLDGATDAIVKFSAPAITMPGAAGKKAGDMTAVKLFGDKSAMNFDYSDKETADGYFCLTTNGACVAKDAELSGTTAYGVNIYIADNGDYDLDKDANKVSDPFAIATTDDDDDSGCVFNPAAGLTLEWLLLLIAPALMVIRRRFK